MEKWQSKIDTELLQADIAALSGALGVTPLTAALLIRQGCKTPEQASAYLQEDAAFCDPFELPDMEAAARRLTAAILQKEKVAIYGDYDVDGVTSVALLTLYLKARGLDVTHYIPDRSDEGYGMNCDVLDRLAAEGHSLIVTVDTGVTALEEARHCGELGVSLIVTDHHACRESLPEALAVVNPRRTDSHYPCPYLAGVGVAFKLTVACELLFDSMQKQGLDSLPEMRPAFDPEAPLFPLCEAVIDLAAIGTVADVMELVGENRTIVRKGLARLAAYPRPAVQALLREAAAEKGNQPAAVNASTIGFTLSPRINAAGRMAHADSALALFLADEGQEPALAAELCRLNRLRQSEETKLLERAERQLVQEHLKSEAAILLCGDSFNGGVIGIVAAKLAERYHKPTFLVSFEGNVGKGSGRSACGIDLVKLLDECADCLVKYGGHSQAAGLTVERERFPEFRRRLTEAAAAAGMGETPPHLYDLDISPLQVTLRQVKELALLEPYGAGNPTPLFCWKNALAEQVMPMGEKHTKLFCSGQGITHQVLLFGKPRVGLDIFAGDSIDLLVELSLNTFRGTTTVQMICREWRQHESSDALADETQKFCSRLLFAPQKELEPWLRLLSPDDLPDRTDCGALYLYLRKAVGYGRQELTSLRRLAIAAEGKLSAVKLTLALRLLSDAGLLCIKGGDPFSLLLPAVEKKVDLTALPLYRQMRAFAQTTDLTVHRKEDA